MHTYESLAYLAETSRIMPMVEVYSGEGIVGWHGNIERQMDRARTTYEAAKNQPYVDKLTAYLTTWRAHPLTGSINAEDINVLLAGADILAQDNWNLKNYFSNLRDSLRRLKASEEELPRGDSGGLGGPGGGMGGGGLGGGLGSLGPKSAIDQELGANPDKLATPDNAELPATPEDDQLPKT